MSMKSERPSYEGLNNEEFIFRLGGLMRSKPFLVEVAENCAAAYDGKEKADLFSEHERDILLGVSGPSTLDDFENLPKIKDKYARNIPGFYAMQEGLFILTQVDGSSRAIDILDSIVRDTIDLKDKDILMRLAHSTWLTATPFRERETSLSVMPYDQLLEKEKEKDWIQIKSSAKTLLEHIV